MLTSSIASDPNKSTMKRLPKSMFNGSTFFNYAIAHVFLPVKLPRYNDSSLDNDHSLARAVSAAAHVYRTYHVDGTPEQVAWDRITKMLDNLQASIRSAQLDKDHVVHQLREIKNGETLAFFMRPHDIAIIFTKQENSTLCESFQLYPMGSSYPQSAVETANEVFSDRDIQMELADLLSSPDAINPSLSNHTVSQCDTLLDSFFRGASCTTDVPRITKHLRYDVVLDEWRRIEVWRRSSLWLLIRVAIQTSLNRSSLGRASYKQFVLFFLCVLAGDENIADLPTDHLQLAVCKILRRLKKLGSFTPVWLSEMALEACTTLGDILDTRETQQAVRPSWFQNPSEDELTRDTQISLLEGGEYIRWVLTNPGQKRVPAPFDPSHLGRGTIEAFLSSNGTLFEEAYRGDPDVTLYDVDRSIKEGIDDWLASVTDVDDACVQLEILMDMYITKAQPHFQRNQETLSVMFLTIIELFIALDKLTVIEIPILADYSPEIPAATLDKLFLRETASLHRLSCAYQYLSARQSRSRPGWSVFSDAFTTDSFAVRYYDQSPHLQRLHARIEADAMRNRIHSPLPSSFFHSKVIVFELQCPTSFRVWRSAIPRIVYGFSKFYEALHSGDRCNLLAHLPELQPYFVKHHGRYLSVSLHLAYFHPSGDRTLQYAIQARGHLQMWKHSAEYEWIFFRHHLDQDMPVHQQSTCMSNDILASQADCPTDLSLDEYIAIGNLLSGSSLQWLSILHGLRNRTLNLRRRRVHCVLSHAVFQVGPLDLNTGTWTWHQELLDPSFCHALIDELYSLFVAVGTSSIDGVLMSNISSLLIRILTSSPSEHVSDRATALLHNVRKKTFKWVEELSYNLTMAPMIEERSIPLLDMAAICRGTFEFTHSVHSYSAEDIDMLLSCALFVYTLRPEFLNSGYYQYSSYLSNVFASDDARYTQLLLQRDHRLSLTLEVSLRDAILSDPSNRGIDLAIRKIFGAYHPYIHRWEKVTSPNSRWLTCKTIEIGDQPLYIMHLNLHDGELRVNGQPVGGLPHAIRNTREYQEIFRDQGFFIVPSNLPGMDFTTLANPSTSKHRVHFTMQDDNILLRVQCSQTGHILELIPSKELWEALPPVLVEGHVHWLHLSTETIEIRPLAQLWEESSENWRIDCTSEEYRVYKGHETLVDIKSPTWTMVASSFWPLNSNICASEVENILVTVSLVDPLGDASVRRLSVSLTDYGLSFWVNQRQELESRDFKGMICDENQSIGTLHRLASVIVLRPTIHATGIPIPEALIPRYILILKGSSSWRKEDALYHTYSVDTDLGCLVGNGNVASMQFLANLHAQSSFYMPDPLTGKTGAQAALCLLQSAGCRSIMRQDRKLLNEKAIVQLTRYPQIDAAYSEIQDRYYWVRYEDHRRKRVDKDAERRAAYLFSWNFPGHVPPKDSDVSTVQHDPSCTLPQAVSSSEHSPGERQPWPVTLDQLLSIRPAPELSHRRAVLRDIDVTVLPDGIPQLRELFSALPRARKFDPSFQREYIAHLEQSAEHASKDSRTVPGLAGKEQMGTLKEHYEQCRSNYLAAMETIKKCLGPTDAVEQALEKFGQWPPTTADYVLRCLASTSPIKVSPCWKKCFISLALLLLDLQRARRLLQFALDGREEEFGNELENGVCDGWNPEDYPDWLLIQVQGNFLIRRTQADIAMEMMAPRSGKNTIMQVNMGEGKTSVIIPIVAAALADGKQLVRVIVPKATTAQMFDLLVARLGGLANRPVYHLPFCRSSKYDGGEFQVDDLQTIMSRCMIEQGILLVQPEHVASLKLMSVERAIRTTDSTAGSLTTHLQPIYAQIMTFVSSISPTASILFFLSAIVDLLTIQPQQSRGSVVDGIFQWLRQSLNTQSAAPNPPDQQDEDDSPVDITPECGCECECHHPTDWSVVQKWIHSHVRDILDESDEVLHSRFQLVYTMGLEQHMDGYPERWTITQRILQLAKEHVHSLSNNHPDVVEYNQGPPGSFPHIHIVPASDVGQRLTLMIVEDVMAGRISGFSFQHLERELYDAIRSFISDQGVLQIPDTVRRVEDYAKGRYERHLWNGLLLLRGLLAYNVLLFALAERRWRVDYGLDSGRDRRTMLAVPYRAKDSPAPHTHFGHPDITIIFTCLSYYYTGLAEEQLRVSFEIMLDQDDTAPEYGKWVKEYDDPSILPDTFWRLSDVNLKSSEEWDKVIFPLFSRNQAAIDFYLSQVVFPKEANEFPWRLSASTWDLAERRDKVLTGFSGTNDNRWLLPMSVSQRDLKHQQGTNAKVLAYLLRPENDSYMVTHASAKRLGTLDFLRMVVSQQPEIRVLLDVGAQVLDLSNRQVAEKWLGIARDTTGAIYFDEKDELMILTRNGKVQPISSTSFSQQLDRCVAYVDHAHMRGTDLKLPLGSRAAVTLGPKLTKDSLVQGCMRMRKLGHGHSIMFFAPLEVDQSIRAVVSKTDPNRRVTTADILGWAIHETWTDIRQRAPYWAQQGMDHKSRYEAWSQFCNGELGKKELADAWLQLDSKSLVDLYTPRDTRDISSSLSALDPGIQQHCKALGVLSLPSAQMEEEQEREVNLEREHEREVELPPKATAAEHSLHADIVRFVKTGDIPRLHEDSAFRPVFTALGGSTAATLPTDAVEVWSPFILATVDFCNTIKFVPDEGTMDQYIRPVQWILTRSKKDKDQVLVLLSPYEADLLMSDIRESKHVHLHLYAPRTRRRMDPSDDLKLYVIPPLPSDWRPPWDLIDQLNVFAGQLYLGDYASYLRLCHFLGVPATESPHNTEIRLNPFSIPGSFERNEVKFQSSRLPSVMALLAIRSRGRPFEHTHMGKILQGLQLTEKDFEVTHRMV